MSILIKISIGLFVWFFVGCIVCVLIDDENESLHKWAKKAPLGMSWLVPMFFPIIIYLYLRNINKTMFYEA